jgi:hypothetical protein
MGRIVTSTGRAATTPVDYLVTNFGGTLSVGADPTAGWSTTLGDVITDGTVTMRVVDAIIPGTTAIRIKTAFTNHFLTTIGGVHVDNSLIFQNSSGTILGETECLRFDASETLQNETIFLSNGILESPTVVVPTGTARYQVRFTIWINANVAGSIDIESHDVYIPYPLVTVP